MIRQYLAALIRAEIEIYVAAMRYVDAANRDLGLKYEPPDLRPARALLDVDPNVLVCGYSTPELFLAAAGSVVRLFALYVLLRMLRLLHPLVKLANNLGQSGTRPVDEEVIITLLLVIATVTRVLLTRVT